MPAQDFAKPITYETRAVPVERVIDDLSRLSGQSLKAATAARGEVLVISVKGAPLGDLMKQIATVTSCEWKPDSGSYWLTPSASARNREESTEASFRAGAIRDAIGKRTKELEALVGSAKPGQTAQPIPPEERAITELLEGVRTDDLASLDAGARMVFSSQPTRMQRPMGSNATQILTRFVKDHNAALVGTEAEYQKQLNRPELQQLPNFVKTMIERQRKPIGSIGKVLLVASRLPFVPSVQLQLRVYDSQGALAFSHPSFLSIQSVMAMANTILGKPGANAPKGTPVQYSDETKQLQAVLRGMMNPGGANYKLAVKPALLDSLEHPERVDPLSFAPSDELLSLAKAKGLPLVADVPDSEVSMTVIAGQRSDKTVEQVESAIRAAQNEKFVDATGWVDVMPSNPVESRAARADRGALRTLIAASLAKGVPSLDDIAAYAQRAPAPSDGGIGSVYAVLLVPGVMSSNLGNIVSWDMLRLYGSFGIEQKHTLVGGGRIRFQNLSPAQRALVSKMVFGPTAPIVVDRGQKPDEIQIPYLNAMMGGGTDYLDEPTESMPNGLSPGGSLSLSTDTEPFAYPVTDDGTPVIASAAELGPEELGAFKMFRDDPKYQMISSLLPTFERVKVGSRTLMKFKFALAPSVSMMEQLNDCSLPKGAPVVSMDDLPADFQARINQDEEKVKKSPLGALGPMLGGAPKPP